MLRTFHQGHEEGTECAGAEHCCSPDLPRTRFPCRARRCAGRALIRLHVDLMILNVFSNVNDSVILMLWRLPWGSFCYLRVTSGSGDGRDLNVNKQ